MTALARRLGAFLALLLVAGCASFAREAPDQPRILIFSHSTGFRHDSIEPGVAALKALAAREGMAASASEDPDVFDDRALADIDVIVLLSTTTDPARPESEFLAGARGAALQRFVRAGGGVLAIHAAADSHYRWPWYGRMIGGHFERHPPGTPRGTLTVADRDHPATRALPERFERIDEWYYYADYDPRMRLLVTLDPASIGETDANPNPISWAHRFEGGRVFYTGMGHTAESYAEPLFLAHLAGGLRWAAGMS